MQLDNLPPEWLKTKLGEVVDYGKSQKCELSDVSDSTWILELEDIEKESSKIVQRLNAAVRPFKSTKNKFKKGDVLYGKLRPYLNKVIIADQDGVCSTEIIPLDAEPHVDNRYLFHWIKSEAFLNYVIEVSYGVNMPRLGTQDGLSAPFVLPPVAEQKVIADKLDTLLAQVDNTKARLERIPEILKSFRQSVLAAAVSGKLTEEWRGTYESVSAIEYLKEIEHKRIKLINGKKLKKSVLPRTSIEQIESDLPNSWSKVHFEHIAAYDSNALKAGPFGSALKKSDCTSSGFRVYGQEQVIAGDESLVTYYINESKFNELSSCAVKSGDILVSLVGTIGKVLILSDKAEKGIINPRLNNCSV
jgi:type I restriction enzyme S subunit